MRVAILITARMGSTRLSDKHLRDMAGRPALRWLLERISTEFHAELDGGAASLWIATGNPDRNAGFSALTSGIPAQLFFGADDNVPLRHLQVAQAHGLDALLSIDGDDIFCAPEAMRAVYDALVSGASLAKTSGLPLGMNAWGYATPVLEQALRGADASVLETGWGRIFDGMAVHEDVLSCPGAEQVRATLDYPEDLEFFDVTAREIQGWEQLPASDLVQAVLSRGLHRINASVTEQYWENFNMGVSSEQTATHAKSYSERLHRVIPGGAHTYSRGDDQYPVNAPQILERAKGSTVWAADGRSFLDYGMALRAVSIGYSEPAINEAAIRGLEAGNNLTRASMIELAAAERLVGMIDSVDMVKFTKNGSTATSAAVKLARAYTGRDLVARCAQHPFFSYDDWFIGNTAITKGIPVGTIEQTKSFAYNDIGSLERLIAEYPDQFACVILEPASTDTPATFIGPDGREVNYLQQVETLCRKHGIVFILDEMITGFRWHLKGAQHTYGVTPDLCTFGKAMANGFSVAAVAGRRELMSLGSIDQLGQERLFLLSTTHGAEMCGLAAYLATMDFLEEHAVVDHLWTYGAKLQAEINGAAEQAGIAKHFYAAGPAVSPYYATVTGEGAPWLELRTLFAQEMIKQGVLMPWLALSYRHGDAELEKTREALAAAMDVCARGVAEGVDKYLIGPAIKPVFRRFN
ncbi:glutamate-1-semialdehyde 2,1-aminomutase [Chromobacterium vaccinii]|uniref:glutamate-1-semialdehyde 2,1-aminomutase n=1 Tax=Chromobacterium vaccinii TaxID=1108595 RepID=UPI000ACA90B9|nr:glutamate-1-semialdehyde 2,1-aminomutase [Chromobacterium vaccinii]